MIDSEYNVCVLKKKNVLSEFLSHAGAFSPHSILMRLVPSAALPRGCSWVHAGPRMLGSLVCGQVPHRPQGQESALRRHREA